MKSLERAKSFVASRSASSRGCRPVHRNTSSSNTNNRVLKRSNSLCGDNQPSASFIKGPNSQGDYLHSLAVQSHLFRFFFLFIFWCQNLEIQKVPRCWLNWRPCNKKSSPLTKCCTRCKSSATGVKETESKFLAWKIAQLANTTPSWRWWWTLKPASRSSETVSFFSVVATSRKDILLFSSPYNPRFILL